MSNKEKESADFQELCECFESLINKVIKSSKESSKDYNSNKKVGKEVHKNKEEFTPSLENRMDSLEVVQDCLIEDVNHLKDSLKRVSHLLENISNALSRYQLNELAEYDYELDENEECPEDDYSEDCDSYEDCCECDDCECDMHDEEEEEEDGEFPMTISDVIEALESLRDDYEGDEVEKVSCTFRNKKSPYGKGFLIKFSKK